MVLSFTLVNAQTITRGPFMTVPTSNSITVQWRTSSASSSEVKYGTSVGSLTSTVSNGSSVTDHIIVLAGLAANTTYYYSVGKIGTVLQGTASNTFKTAPINGSGTRVKFWVTGDFGNGSSGQINVRNSFTSYVGSEPLNGWIWLGDNAYNNGTDAEFQTKVFDVYTTIFKSLPIFPALGNHDYGQTGYLSATSRGISAPYFTIFALPTNGDREKYYSTNYGNVHFIALDSYGSYNAVGSAMYNWLQADLAANTQLWTIVYFHHPPYSKGGHNSDSSTELVDMRTNIIPLLESYGVDVVLSGHSHAYERSFFLKGHFGLENTFNNSMKVQPGDGNAVPYTKSTRTGPGTVYVVCGVSGQVGGTSSGYPHNAMQYSTASTNGSLILTVTAGVLNCKFLTAAGNIDDQFNIVKTISTLPISLIHFEARSTKNKTVDFVWSTASEINNAFFTIERTSDLESIIPIVTMPGAGNSTTQLDYSASDTKPLSGISYYRLKQTDYDGTATYSDWKMINLSKSATAMQIKRIYPNPISDKFIIELDNPIAGSFDLIMYDVTGREIYKNPINLDTNTNTILCYSNNFSAGVYIISLTNSELTMTSRIFIK